MTIIQAVVLGTVVAVQLICALAILLIEDPFDRLHLVWPVSVMGSILVMAAVVAAPSSTSHLAKVLTVALFVWASSPFVTRATARALRIRESGELAVDAGEREEGRSA